MPNGGIFLAFAQHDAPRASALDALLRACGARTAFDEDRELDNGLPSEPVLQDLGACDAVLLLWSRHTADDDCVSEQRRLAASFDKPLLIRSLDATQVPPDAGEHPGRRFPPGDDDREVAAAVFRFLGTRPRSPAPRPGLAVGPGRWQITSDAQHGETLDLELTADDSAASPTATDAGHLTGVHRRAGTVGEVTGRWRSDPETGRLDLDLASSFGLRPHRALRQLQLLSGTDQALTAEDLHGIATVLHYRLTREASS